MNDKDEVLTIAVDNKNDIIATRSKTSVEIDREKGRVIFSELYYTYEEVSAITQKLEDMGLVKTLTFS